MAVPTYDNLFNPLLKAMHQLGGSATVSEQEDKVSKILNLSDKEVNEIHRGNRTKLSYRLAWSRNYLKRYGLLENSTRGVWSLTSQGKNVHKVNKKKVNSLVKTMDKSVEKLTKTIGKYVVIEPRLPDWQDELINTLKNLSPQEFEKLCQRILREAGFIEVEVTGRSGDGGIDGRGIFKIGGFLSFRVIFQCKRYNGVVSPKEIREFKGTMSGRADKGLFLTTGTFTREARQEAQRDGSIPIDLVNGQELAEKMRELGLGIKISTKENVEIDKDWFKSF